MVERIPSVILAVGVAALACGDWLVAGSTAEDPADAPVAAPAPAELPADAKLDVENGRAAVVQGCTVLLRHAGARGYALVVRNPGTSVVTLACDVEAWVTEGSNVGRMGPMARLQATELVSVTVPAGGSVVHPLAFADPAPPADETAEQAELRKAWSFRSVEMRLLAPLTPQEAEATEDEAPERTQLARLRPAAAPATSVARPEPEARSNQ